MALHSAFTFLIINDRSRERSMKMNTKKILALLLPFWFRVCLSPRRVIFECDYFSNSTGRPWTDALYEAHDLRCNPNPEPGRPGPVRPGPVRPGPGFPGPFVRARSRKARSYLSKATAPASSNPWSNSSWSCPSASSAYISSILSARPSTK